MQKKKVVVKTGISHIFKLLKLVCVFAIGAVPIHDVATREKHLLGSELAFMHFYLILDRVPKYSTKQSLPLYNTFRLDLCRDQSQMIDVLVIRLCVDYFLSGDRQIRELMLHRHSLPVLVMHGAAVHSMYCLIIAFIPAVNTTKISGPCCC